MHPNPAFRLDERDLFEALIAEIGFGMIFAATPDGPRVAHVPAVFLDADRLGFHIARGNGIARHLDGQEALFVLQGPDAYISPDWYGLGPDQVPTWNYIAVECQGVVRKLDGEGLAAQVEQLTAQHEARLAPKPAWTRSKMPEGLYDRMARGITGFALEITGWRGTLKLGQNKSEAARLSAAAALDAAGQRAMAHLMRTLPL